MGRSCFAELKLLPWVVMVFELTTFKTNDKI